jgi:Phage portal protein
VLTPAEILAAGRRRLEPRRDSDAYARLQNIGGWTMDRKRPLIKPTAANLRSFGKTTFARRAIKRIKDPIEVRPWEIAPKPGVKLNSLLQKQIDIATHCLQQPNHDDSFRSFVGQLVEDILVNGAGVYEQQIGADKTRPLWLWPVDSMSIQINPAWDGKDSEPRYFQTLGYGNIGGVQGKALLNSELVYVRQDPMTESPFGLGQLEVAFKAISNKLGVADYAGKLASNAQPENILVMPGMQQEQVRTMRNWWRNEIEGQGMLPIVGAPAGSKPEMVSLHATDDKSLFIQYQELLIKEIATSFNLHAMSFGVYGTLNRATAEVIDDADWENAVVPVATLIAAYITRETIEARLGFSQLEFRFVGLKRDDKKAEAEIFKLEYTNNAATPNEYRERNNMPPLEGIWGDKTYADFQIAMQAARGTGEIDDPDLPPARPTPGGGKSSK